MEEPGPVSKEFVLFKLSRPFELNRSGAHEFAWGAPFFKMKTPFRNPPASFLREKFCRRVGAGAIVFNSSWFVF